MSFFLYCQCYWFKLALGPFIYDHGDCQVPIDFEASRLLCRLLFCRFPQLFGMSFMIIQIIYKLNPTPFALRALL